MRCAKALLLDGDLERRLLIRPQAHADEQAQGHWLRIAHVNGLKFPHWLLDRRGYLPKGVIRVCPSCLGQPNPWWRSAWCDHTRPWCTTHNLWLVDTCTRCRRPLRWRGVHLLQCRCGQAFSELPKSQLTSECSQALITEQIAPLSVVVWLGALAKQVLSDNPFRKANLQGVAAVIDLAERGAGMVNDWPESFFRALENSRVHAPDGESIQLLNMALPGLTRRIRKLNDPGWRKHIETALGVYATASKKTNSPIIGRNLGGRDTVYKPVATVARALGMGTSILIRTFDSLTNDQAIARRTANGRSRRLITPEVIQKVQSYLEDQISTKAAAKLLGLSADRIEQLVNAKLLTRKDGFFSKTACNILLQSVMQAVVRKKVPSDAIPLREELKFRITVNRSSHLLEAIMSGDLVVYAKSTSRSIQSLLLGRESAMAWIATRSDPRSEWLTVPEYARHLGVKQEVAYHLVRVGLLFTQKAVVNRHLAQLVTLEEQEQFERNYEPLTKAASRAGVHWRHGLAWARANGLTVVSGPEIDGGRQYFIRISPSE